MGLLADHLYANRCLLIFAPSPENTDYKQQLQTVRACNADLLDRDITVVEVAGDEEVLIDGAAADDCDASELRVEFGVNQGEFALILVSKDGAIQLHEDTPQDTDSLMKVVGSTPNYAERPHSSVTPY